MKNDFLKECMSDIGMIPIDEFSKAYCIRCVNQNCARSASNNHAFVKRATTWKETLFTHVSRAPNDDPQYSEIRSKLFIPGRNFVGSVNSPIQPELIEEIPLVAETDKQEEIDSKITKIQSIPESVPAFPSPSTIVRNTPFEQGLMLGEVENKFIQPGDTVVFDDE